MKDRWPTPIDVLALFTGAKSFAGNPLIGSSRLNAWGLHARRLKLAQAMAWGRRRSLRSRTPAGDAAAFDRDGYIHRPDFLPAVTFERLRSDVLATSGPARAMVQGATTVRRLALDSDFRRRAPGLESFFAHPDWLPLMQYVGASELFPLVYLQAIFPNSRSGAIDPQTRVHADTFHPTLKAFYFLEDVGPEDGPFCYVRGSHRLTPGRLAWEHAESVRRARSQDVLTARGSPRAAPADLDAMGFPPPAPLDCRANTLVVADTFGFHARGVARSTRPRLELSFYSRRNPFLPWLGGDPIGWPFMQLGVGALAWRLEDAAAALGGPPPTWKKEGDRTIGAPLSPAEDERSRGPIEPLPVS
jgi:hypothetical protein